MYDYLEATDGSIYTKEIETRDFIEISPLKANDQNKAQQIRGVAKKQMKLTSMPNCVAQKHSIVHQNVIDLTSTSNDKDKSLNQCFKRVDRDGNKSNNNNSLSDTSLNKMANEKNPTQNNNNWKIKAIIDNRNFLIPLV